MLTYPAWSHCDTYLCVHGMGPLVWTVAGPDHWLDVMPGGSVIEILGKAGT